MEDLILDTLVASAARRIQHQLAAGEDEALLAALRLCHRDIYQETVDATGIDPIREMDAERSVARARAR